MEWDALFADLESRFEAERRADLAAQSAELAQAEAAAITLADRLRARVGHEIHLRTRTGHQVDGLVREACPAFVRVDEGAGVQALVPVAAVALAAPLAGLSVPAGEVERRTGLAAAARALARSGARVRVLAAGGEVAGRIVRVGADHVDVLPDAATGGVSGRVSIALAAVEVVRSR